MKWLEGLLKRPWTHELTIEVSGITNAQIPDLLKTANTLIYEGFCADDDICRDVGMAKVFNKTSDIYKWSQHDVTLHIPVRLAKGAVENCALHALQKAITVGKAECTIEGADPVMMKKLAAAKISLVPSLQVSEADLNIRQSGRGTA